MTITVNGPNGITINFPEGTDAGTIESVMQEAIGGAPAPQEKVGFGERGQREQDMPITPEAQHELDVTKRMARYRPDFGAGDLLQNSYVFGLGDEAKAAGSAVGGILRGNNPVETYRAEKEARNRLADEYREKNPKTALAAELTGGFLSATPAKMAAAPARVPVTFKEKAAQLGKDALESGKNNAIFGAIQGFGEGDGLEDSLVGAGRGALLGGAIGGAAPAVTAGIGALARPAVNAVRGAVNPEKEAARRAAEALRRDGAAGGTMDRAAYDAARASGQPLVLADMGGESTRGLARSAANTSGEARQALLNATDDRFAGQAGRLDDALAGESTLGMSADDAMDAAREAAKKANGPAYQKAYKLGEGSVWDDTLEGLAQTPALQTALKRAVSKWRNKAATDPWMKGLRLFNPPVSVDDVGDLVFRNADGLPSHPNLRMWDFAKQELDDMASAAARNGDKGMAKDLGDLSRALRNHLDSLGDMGQAYKAARQTASAHFGAEDAYSAGRAFAAKGKDMRLPDAAKALAKMTPEERRLFKEGYVAHERERLSQLADNRDATLTTLNSPDARARAELALGKDGAKRLGAQVEVERAMQATRKAFGNSTTARQLVELGLAGGAGSTLAGASTGDWSMSNLSMGAAAGGFAKWGRGRIDERVARRVGELLASNDPKRLDALIRLASQSPKYLNAVRALRIGASAQASVSANSALGQ